MIRVAALLVAIPSVAAADPRPFHGSVGGGGSLLVTGEGDASRQRFGAELDLLPGRYGVLFALRDAGGGRDGLLCAGLLFEAGAARPRLALDFYADAGFDLDARRPLAGGGVRTTLGIYGPLGIALDLGGQLVVGALAETRLQIAPSAMLVARW